MDLRNVQDGSHFIRRQTCSIEHLPCLVALPRITTSKGERCIENYHGDVYFTWISMICTLNIGAYSTFTLPVLYVHPPRSLRSPSPFSTFTLPVLPSKQLHYNLPPLPYISAPWNYVCYSYRVGHGELRSPDFSSGALGARGLGVRSLDDPELILYLCPQAREDGRLS